MREVTIALAQTAPVLDNNEENLRRMANIIQRICSEQPTNLIVFPELAVSGYECGLNFTRQLPQAVGPPGGQHQAPAASGQGARRGSADPARGSADDGQSGCHHGRAPEGMPAAAGDRPLSSHQCTVSLKEVASERGW